MKKIIFIVITVLIFIGGSFYLAFKIQKGNNYEFNKDGYVLVPTIDNISSKHYFSAGSKYQKKYPSKIMFNDVDKNKVISNNNSFVHYNDGSLSVFNKSAILDLNTINDNLVDYYNIFIDTELIKSNDGYIVSNGSNKLKFSDFIIKTANNKYLIVSKKLSIKIGNEVKKIVSDYLELNFVEGDIILIENQEASYKTVALKSFIEISDNLILNLLDHYIYSNDKKIVSLEEITINSDDNIEILPSVEKEETKEPEKPSKPNDNSNILKPDNGNLNNGGSTNDKPTISEDVSDPKFYIEKMDITANRVHVVIKVTDDDGLLNNTKEIKILETDSGKTVYQNEENTGSYQFEIITENLVPETNYTLIVKSDYVKKGILYNRNFISKAFRTEHIGLNVKKDYYTDEKLRFKITAEEYSNIKTARLSLLTSDSELLKTAEIDGNIAKKEPLYIDFDDLNPDTIYIIKIDNFFYDNSIIVSQKPIIKEVKTLKSKPTFGNPNFVINKRTGSVTIEVGNVQDNYNGIKNYRYEIYDSRTLNEDIKPVKIVNKDKLGTVDLLMDEQVLFRGVPYVFKLITEFNDNEKIVEYESKYSDIFKLDGVQFPTLSFEEKDVTFERIKGLLKINDFANTVSLDPNTPMNIVYKNSIGVEETITAANSLIIPIDVNDLRANETYVFSVYATINLQDGNPPIASCFIGEVCVQTKNPKPFLLNTSINSNDVTTPFSISMQLSKEQGDDNTLEANTLSSVTFNLYEGKNVRGKLVKSVRKVDRDLSAYNSYLKDDYYDKNFDVTPEFFGIRNNDLGAKFYTISVDDANDYTRYKNKLEINNNTITVKTNGYVPSLPPQEKSSLDYKAIYNKDTGPDLHREDLDENTIVGYNVTAIYDNAKRYAKHFNYYVHNEKGEIIDSIENVIVGEEGIVPSVKFYIKDGTENAIEDKDFRRGNRYYFSYEAFLDLNGDGLAETKYPINKEDGNNIVLKTPTFVPKKQQAHFKFYLSKNDWHQMIWKYKFSDIDNASLDNLIYYKINGIKINNLQLTLNSTEWNSLVIDNPNAGWFEFYIKECVQKKEEVERTLIYQYFDKSQDLSELKYQLIAEKNRVSINLLGTENKNIYNRVAALKVVFEVDGMVPIVKDFLVLDNNLAVIDLFDLQPFSNKNIKVSVYAYYDTSISGFDVDSEYFALRRNKDKDGGGEYLRLNPENNFSLFDEANGTVYNATFNETKLFLKDLVSNQEKEIPLEIDKKGVVYNYDYLSLQKIELTKLAVEGNSTFRFDKIIPGVSVLDRDGKLSIIPALRYAEAYIKIYGERASSIENNTIFIDVFETDEHALIEKKVSRIPVKISDLQNPIKIANLVPNTYYFFRVYANIYSNGTYVEEQLYDFDFQTTSKSYYFKTLNTIGITNMTNNYNGVSYNEKYITLFYSLDRIVGYDEIRYKVFKKDSLGNRTLVDIDIPSDTYFQYEMKKNIPIVIDGPLNVGENYILEITPVSFVYFNGEKKEILLEPVVDYMIKVPLFRNAFIGINKMVVNDTTIDFKISIHDIYKVIVGDIYKLEFFDDHGVDVTPLEYKNKNYSVNELNKVFRFSNIRLGVNYTLVITTFQNLNNKTDSIEKLQTEIVTSTLDDSGIYLGDVYTSTNVDNRNKIDLTFYNSFKLNHIDKLRYSIYNISNYAIDNYVKFVPKLISDNKYLFELPDILPDSGIYYLELQFIRINDLGKEEIVKQLSLEHNFN